MARKRKSNTGLPPCVYRKNGGYHLVKNNKWQKIGTTYAEMMRTYAALTEPSAPGAEPRTVGHLLDRYLVERSPLKASETQSTHTRDIRQLRAVFGDVLLSDVRPEHCGQYFRARACFASARREVALMSDAMSWACLEGWMSFNPFKGINKAQFRQSLARQESVRRPEPNILLQGSRACSSRPIRPQPIGMALDVFNSTTFAGQLLAHSLS